MDLESMFSEQRWNIIRCLAETKHSPLQLAGKLNTTIANISQQLRLLQAADLVKIERVPSRAKGKPRKFFSLSNDYAYLISAMNELTDKKLLELTDHHKAILQIWFLENKNLHYNLEKFYWSIEKHREDIDAIAIQPSDTGAQIILVANRDVEKHVLSALKKINAQELSAMVCSKEQVSKLETSSSLAVLYDRQGIFGGDAKV